MVAVSAGAIAGLPRILAGPVFGRESNFWQNERCFGGAGATAGAPESAYGLRDGRAVEPVFDG